MELQELKSIGCGLWKLRGCSTAGVDPRTSVDSDLQQDEHHTRLDSHDPRLHRAAEELPAQEDL
jgi:hypothetical protein